MSPAISEEDYIVVAKYSKLYPNRDIRVTRDNIELFNLDKDHLSATFQKDVSRKELNRKFIKRAVGIAGDKVLIRNGDVFVNGHLESNHFHAIRHYLIHYKNLESYYKILETKDIRHKNLTAFGGLKSNIFISKFQLISIDTSALIKKPIPIIDTISSPKIFPRNLNWSLDNWGPVVIPKAGDSVNITLSNISLYHQIILRESRSLEIIDNTIIIDGKMATRYIFKENYCFVLGDNRYESMDSRHFGFVPYENLLGEVILVM